MTASAFAEDDGLPKFSGIRVEEIEPTIRALIADNKREIETLLEVLATDVEPSWDRLAAPLEELDDRLNKAWAPISHLNAVVNTPELRAAHDACQPLIAQYATELGQSRPLYDAYRRLADGDGYGDLDAAQRKIVSDALRDFQLSGVALPSVQKGRFAQIAERLAVLSSDFANNVLDATDAWSKSVSERDVPGLPESHLRMAADAAQARGQDGLLLTLEAPSFVGVMDHCANRDLRREVHEAYVTRASDVGPHAGKFDNSAIMAEILALRFEQARLLGFDDYAERSMATKMATGAGQVQAFLDDLLDRCLPVARRDLDELRAYGAEAFGIDDVQPWDVRFLTERLQQAKYAVGQEELKPYFPLDHVRRGLFAIAERLFGIRIDDAQALDVWHEDASFHTISRDGERIAGFYLDPFARPRKRSGAWMAACRDRRQAGNFLQLPAAFLTCNFSPPAAGQPALLTHAEVVTLFHEFGHGLHHMLTRARHGPVSGINGVEWDAVELPSQFMENWCWQPQSIALISRHWQTGEPLPETLLDKLLAAKNFQAGARMLRQLEFGLFDLALHRAGDAADPAAIAERIRGRTALVPVPRYDRFAWSFGHIFAGGYAAGYYSYLWAEVLSADAFAAFEEEGAGGADKLAVPAGRRFLIEVLERGGTRTAEASFLAFRGRAAEPAALLRHSGIAPPA